jgi:hypothetical protein
MHLIESGIICLKVLLFMKFFITLVFILLIGADKYRNYRGLIKRYAGCFANSVLDETMLRTPCFALRHPRWVGMYDPPPANGQFYVMVL